MALRNAFVLISLSCAVFLFLLTVEAQDVSWNERQDESAEDRWDRQDASNRGSEDTVPDRIPRPRIPPSIYPEPPARNPNLPPISPNLPTRVPRPPLRPPTIPTSTTTRKPSNGCSCPTTSEYNPVCGTDGVSYSNPGKLNCAMRCGQSVSLLHYGNCSPTDPNASSSTSTTTTPSSTTHRRRG